MFKTDTEDYSVVRGCEKRIYHVKNTESDIFDEAYLVLKRQDKTRTASPRELEREALRIVRGTVIQPPSVEKHKKHENLLAYIAGVLSSAIVIALVSLVLWLAL